MNITAIDIFAIVMLGYFLILGPILARREMAQLRRDVADGKPRARLDLYRRTIVMEWGLMAVSMAWWLIIGRSPAEAGLRFTFEGWQWLALALSMVAMWQFARQTHRASQNPKNLDSVRSQLGELVVIAPHTDAELQRFTWVSIAAGICEEILYRGLLMTTLTAMLGLWPAVLLSSVVFGIGHAYQGAAGIVRTGLAGLVMALVVVFTGSLPAAMLMHAVLDIVQGRLLWAAVNSDRTPPPYSANSAPSSA